MVNEYIILCDNKIMCVLVTKSATQVDMIALYCGYKTQKFHSLDKSWIKGLR